MNVSSNGRGLENGEMTVDDELGTLWKEMTSAHFKLLSQM
jgi:hypothetical protein